MSYLDFDTFMLLRVGNYPLAKDQNIYFDLDDLKLMATAFNDLKPLRPAPIVIGHPTDDKHPSYGEVVSVQTVDRELVGHAQKLSDSFRRSMREGAYPRYAAQFFAPENPDNPAKGSWLLRHVGFMGPVPLIRRGFLTTDDAEFMESLSGPGLKIELAMRWGAPDCIEFSERATAPRTANDIACVARAAQEYSRRAGNLISITQAVGHVLESRGMESGR